MSVRIEVVDGEQLALSGDLDTRVALPRGAQEGTFSLAFSDGTLISGTHDPSARSCVFDVQIEGASLIRIDRQQGRETLVLDWQMEWMMVAPRAELPMQYMASGVERQLVLGLS